MKWINYNPNILSRLDTSREIGKINQLTNNRYDHFQPDIPVYLPYTYDYILNTLPPIIMEVENGSFQY